MNPATEDQGYLQDQLITYIGNKRSLLHLLDQAVRTVQRRLGRNRLRILDAFAGSGVVSRLFKQHSALLISNDLEAYAKVIGDCYLANRSAIDMAALRDYHRFCAEAAAALPVRDGFIRRLYAPRHAECIQPEDRVFFTIENAMRIDSIRHRIGLIPEAYRAYLLGPLLSEASIHNNTAGVFKGFYKNAAGVGQFGGSNRDALKRILGAIELPFPIFSRHECEVDVRQADANELVRTLPELDLAYFDPPYNQHPYGSNYFMLNLIVAYQEPRVISRVSGIPPGWQRSHYNNRARACLALADLAEQTPATHLLISFNSEGFITRKHCHQILNKFRILDLSETVYNVYRASRNLHQRPKHVTEHIVLAERR